jgi:hypothetical protein
MFFCPYDRMGGTFNIKAVAEYETAQQAIREKTARLRALRLERDAAKQAGSIKPGAV